MITDDQIKLMIGSLLHDIGKVVYRSGDGRNHSQSGYEYLKNEAHISDDEILKILDRFGSYAVAVVSNEFRPIVVGDKIAPQ